MEKKANRDSRILKKQTTILHTQQAHIFLHAEMNTLTIYIWLWRLGVKTLHPYGTSHNAQTSLVGMVTYPCLGWWILTYTSGMQTHGAQRWFWCPQISHETPGKNLRTSIAFRHLSIQTFVVSFFALLKKCGNAWLPGFAKHHMMKPSSTAMFLTPPIQTWNPLADPSFI